MEEVYLDLFTVGTSWESEFYINLLSKKVWFRPSGPEGIRSYLKDKGDRGRRRDILNKWERFVQMSDMRLVSYKRAEVTETNTMKGTEP